MTITRYQLLQELSVIRRQRKYQASKKHVLDTVGPPPKLTLDILTSAYIWYGKLVKDLEKTDKLDELEEAKKKLKLYSDMIENEDYAKPGTPEMEYRDHFYNVLNSFEWPTAEELALREVTENIDELLLKGSSLLGIEYETPAPVDTAK